MRATAIAVALGLVLGMGGCAALDWAVGVKPDGSRDPSGGPVGVAAPLVDAILPGAGAALAAAGGLWAALRARKWRNAAIATFDVIEAGAKAGKGVRALKEDLAQAHREAGVYELVKGVVDRYGHSPQVPLQILPQAPQGT